METTMIEKLDRVRYNLLKWFAFGWALWYGAFILKDVVQSMFVIGVFLAVGLAGWIIWTINMIRFYRLGKIVSQDEVLKEALNDELHQFNTARSYKAGYTLTIFTIALFVGLSTFFTIPTLLAFQITLYVSVLSVLISFLIFNKN
jgi:hypothetical protein